jgi:exopolysaccharide biosynthesis predicted pyruvyltransferase EpsI
MNSLGKPTILFVSTKGNRGDELIVKGAEYVLDTLGFPRTKNMENADYIIINGGGYFNSFWDAGNKILHDYRSQAPNIPIIMGPQTYQFTESIYKNFCFVCALSPAPIILFCRESKSYEHLQTWELPHNVEIKLSDDFAFELKDSPFIQEHRQSSSQEYILVSMRSDKESSSPWISQIALIIDNLRSSNAPNLLVRLLGKIRSLSIPLVWKSNHREILRQHEQFNFPCLYTDASSLSSFESFCDIIDKAAFIITDRLHVSIYAHLLNKSVAIISHPNYYKIRGVYEYSMKQGSTVKIY